MTLLRSLTTVLLAGAAATVLVAAPAVAAPSDQDVAWMTAAHQGNLAEIASGQAAVQQAATDDVRRLGQMLVDDHTTLDANLTAAAQQLGVTLPSTPTPEQQAGLASVTAQSGEAFDRAWIALQVPAHRATLAAGATEVASGSDPTVVALAQASAPVVQHHLDELVRIAPEYGVPTAVDGGTGGQAATSPLAVALVLGGLGLAMLAVAGVRVARRRA